MDTEFHFGETIEPELLEADQSGEDASGVSRREFVQILGAGLVLTMSGDVALAQRRGGRGFGGGGPTNIAARIHLGADGTITVMAGKVELGQGARTELTQAAAEELRVAADQIHLILADTALVPNDGVTAGSGTTPRTVPAMRKAAAAARNVLVDLASKAWQVDRDTVSVENGVVTHKASNRSISYAELAKNAELAKQFAQSIPSDVKLKPVSQWKVMGTPVRRPNGRDIVTGAHRYASDIVRPGMLYGKVLRPPSYGATLKAIDLAPAKAMPGVTVVHEGTFVGCAAATSQLAQQAVAALAKTATWETVPHSSSKELYSYLKEHAGASRGGRRGSSPAADPAAAKSTAATAEETVLEHDYEVAYIQHAPMETRSGVAEWNDGKLTVWACTANPFGVRGELAGALGVSADHVHVIAPDVGGAFGGKHQCEAAVEAARLARAAGRPVSVHWTRQEEFTWAYFRPAGVIEMRGALDAKRSIAAWQQVNINSGQSAVDTPYDVAHKTCRSMGSNSPLRQGSYRALAATANNFARESFMDELAHAAGLDPLAFRLAHLKNARLRAVLEAAAERFAWNERRRNRAANIGYGLACGTEKGSFVAACAEVAVDRDEGKIHVRRICEVFECGAIQNPANLLSQVQGCIVMGLGGALSEEIQFADGKILNASFNHYHVPRFQDVPELDVHLLSRPDLDSAGAGETPIIAVAPAVANAVFHATGVRVRSMPIRGAALREAST